MGPVTEAIGIFAMFILLFFRGCVPCCPDASSYIFDPERQEITGRYRADDYTLRLLKSEGYVFKSPSIVLSDDGNAYFDEFPDAGTIGIGGNVFTGRGEWRCRDSYIDIRSPESLWTEWRLGHRGDLTVIVIPWGDTDCCEFLYFVKQKKE